MHLLVIITFEFELELWILIVNEQFLMILAAAQLTCLDPAA